MSRITLEPPWLDFHLGHEMDVLSWSINKPGFVQADRILWREVRNADLPPGMDIRQWTADALKDRNAEAAVLLLTSRAIGTFEHRRAHVGQTKVETVVTVGLSNGERVGHRVDYSQRDWGTINLAVRISDGLTRVGLLEAMSIAVQARTAAVMDENINLPTGVATGTGTDCVAIAAPSGATDFVGLHTDTGEAIGRSVYDAVRAGTSAWRAEQGERQNA